MFQSTHPRGVRRSSGGPHPLGCPCFNPRTHVGCDLQMSEEEKANSSFQSTHPRGVRRPTVPASCPDSWFQSTHPRGVRQAQRSVHDDKGLFQSTHPRGVRHSLPRRQNFRFIVSIHAPTWGATPGRNEIRAEKWSFNPRTHVGCDRPSGPSMTTKACFNPRTHVGCDTAFPAARTFAS